MTVDMKWTGKRFVVLENVVEIEVIGPGEESRRQYHLSGDYDIYNETTGVRIKTNAPADGQYSEYGTSAYEIVLWEEEAQKFLTEIDYLILYSEDRTVNQESNAAMEKWERENPQEQQPEDIPF